MKIKTFGSASLVAALLLSIAPCSQAAIVNVFLDSGSIVPGSSNTGAPYANGVRDASWDVAATVESGLADMGAAVMSVRMVTFNVDANSRTMNSGGGNGLAVAMGSNNLWMDGSTGEAAVFQLTFYSDAAKTMEITGLDITLKSIHARRHSASGGLLGMRAYAGSGALALSSSDNDGVVSLGGVALTAGTDAANSFASDGDFRFPAADFSQQELLSNDTVVFAEDDTVWLRRINLSGGDNAYQLGAVTFDVVPDPAKATNPDPTDRLLSATGTTLSWTSGAGAVGHDIYLGTDFTEVMGADTNSTGIYRDRQTQNTYGITGLVEGETYYWRIDEVDSGGQTSTGNIWSFSVLRDLYSDTWVATDAIDRSLPGHAQCGPLRQDKYVGVFYYLWLDRDAQYYDITQILAENPETAFNDKPWGPVTTFHHWGQPEAGYYRTVDEWVIRRHMSMLVDAGVDFLFFDATNGKIYEPQFSQVLAVMQAMRADGLDTPQVCFATHFLSPQSVTGIYDSLYSPGLYSDLWFYWQGKPLMLGYPDGIEADGDSRTNVTQEIRDFFTWRECWSDDAGQHKWQWQDLEYPQDHGWDTSSDIAEQAPAGVGGTAGNACRSRSYHDGIQPGLDEYYLSGIQDQGLYFSEQWSEVELLDPTVFMIAEWNEWTMQRAIASGGMVGVPWINGPLANGDTYFWGLFNQEYSRDIEPMKGGHTDNYYYQMIDMIRRFKGVRDPSAASPPKTISIDGGFSDWTGVKPEFRDTVGDTFHRNHAGWIGAGTYVNDTGRNDLLNMKVARDATYIYFYAETEENLTSYTDPSWMLLHIDADQDKSTGWEGYEYVVNWQVNDSSSTTLYNGYLGGKAKQGWWKLDEGLGATAIDSSGNGYDGTILGSPSWGTGKFGQAIDFDGVDDRVNVTIDVSETDYAVSLWFKTTTGNCGIFEVNDGIGGVDRILHLSSGNIHARVWENETIATSGTNYADGQWHHVVHTLGGIEGGQKVYVDGQLQASGTKAFSDFDWQTSLSIGYGSNPGNKYFSGLIDDVRIFDEALSASYVGAIFNGTSNEGIINDDILYACSGNQIEIRVPRSDIGQGSGADPVALDFHWADNTQADNDISEFFVSGDSAPNRRFNYRYETREADATELLSDGFESGVAENYWGEWDITEAEAYSGTHSLEGSLDDSDMVTPVVSTAGKDSFHVSFKYKLRYIEDYDDVKLYYSDGSNWEFIEELGTAQNDVWLYYSDVRYNTGADTQFFHGLLQFAIAGAGVNASHEFVWIDDFKVVCNSGSEPSDATAGYYAAWAASFGLDDTNGAGNALCDFESDGVYNLVEYALGGNPTSNDAASILPTFGVADAGGGSNVIDYVYNRRQNPASLGLAYELYTSTNLLSNDWIYVGTDYETGSAEIDPDFDAVSNSVPFGTDQGFIELKIEGDF